MLRILLWPSLPWKKTRKKKSRKKQKKNRHSMRHLLQRLFRSLLLSLFLGLRLSKLKLTRSWTLHIRFLFLLKT